MYAAKSRWLPASDFISCMSRESLGAYLRGQSFTPAGGAWPAGNRTIYVPIWPTSDFIATRMFVANGSTVGTDTHTVAAYISAAGLPSARLVTASATSAGATAPQFFDITDTPFFAGRLYFIAMAMSGTTATVQRDATINLEVLKTLIFQDASNCPDPAVPAAVATAFLPIFGLTVRTSP